MYSDGAFVPNDISSSNIAKLDEKQSVITEQKICEIYDIAKEAADAAHEMHLEGYDVYEILSVISEGIKELGGKFHASASKLNLGRIINALNSSGIQDKAVFSELFCECMNEFGSPLFESDFLTEHKNGELFTYVKNILADEAFDVFSQDFLDPRVVYSRSLAEAARSVSSGECQYCLLPLEERGGARLSVVAELLFKEDLKINSVIPVFGPEGNTDMKYALVSKSFSIPKILSDDDRYLEIRLRIDSSIPLSGLFSAADVLGASLYRVNTISFETEDGSVPHYSIVFKDDARDFVSLLVFLTLFSGAYTPIGIYKNLE